MPKLKYYAIRMAPGAEMPIIRDIKERFLCAAGKAKFPSKPAPEKAQRKKKGLDKFFDIVGDLKGRKKTEPVCLVDELITDFRGYVVVGVTDTGKALALSRSLKHKHRMLFGVLGERELSQLRNKEIEDFFDVGDVVSPKVGPLKGEKVEIVSISRHRGLVKVKAVGVEVPISFDVDISDLKLLEAARK